MSDSDDRKRQLRETLKRLREERGEQVKAATAASAAVRGERKKIVAEMATEPRTVPQLADATDLPTDRVLWHLAAMRKYGQLTETGEQDGDYFKYALVAKEKDSGDKAAKDKDDGPASAEGAQT